MTEKDYNPEQKNAKSAKKSAVAANAKPAAQKAEKVEKPKTEKAEVKEEPKKEEKKVEKKIVKKESAEVNARSLPISTLDAKYICKFIKGKTIEKAIADLEQVIVKRKAVPMKGEIPHKKGKRMMSGRFPGKASGEFITILKGLRGNAVANGIEEPVIVEAVANLASRPFGRFGRVRKKRSHVRLVTKTKKTKKKEKTKQGEKK